MNRFYLARPMRSFLTQPYPFSDDLKRKLLVCGCIGLFVTLFLRLFEPFGFNNLPATTVWFHASLFGLVTFAVSFFFQAAVPEILPSVFIEERWRSWKEIIFLLITTLAIGAANYGLMALLYKPNESAAGFWKAQLMTLQVGLFPVVAVVFMKQLTLYRRFATEAAAVTEDIREEEGPAVQPPTMQQAIVLKGDGQKEELSFALDDLLFIASADNYVSIHFRDGGALKSTLLRSTLKKMEEQLITNETFFRCHRMYLVNLRAVETVSGNAQGLRLHFAGAETLIPVSRSLTEAVKIRLHAINHSPQMA